MGRYVKEDYAAIQYCKNVAAGQYHSDIKSNDGLRKACARVTELLQIEISQSDALKFRLDAISEELFQAKRRLLNVQKVEQVIQLVREITQEVA